VRTDEPGVKSSSLLFNDGALDARRSADLQLAWRDAADDAHEAYFEWCAAARAERTEAFLVYHAAIDREEAAARALELQLSGRRPRR
jgi:hypothetical protein